MMSLTFKSLQNDFLFYKTPIRVIDKLYYLREYAIIKVQINDKIFTAELSPLPNFHPQTLKQCIQQYTQLLENRSFTLNPIHKLEPTRPGFNLISLPLDIQKNPPLLYAIESVLWKYLYPQEINQTTKSPKVQSALLQTVSTTVGQTIKLKIRPTQSIHLQKNTTYRLDGNRTYTPQELEQQLTILNSHQIEFIEDPFKDRNHYKNFFSYPLALDENLLWGLEQQIKFDYAIIKPSLYGLSGTIRLIKQCQQQAITPIISSSFEGYNQHRLLEDLIYKYKLESILHGLSPKNFIHPISKSKTSWNDLFTTSFWKSRGMRASQIAKKIKLTLKNHQLIGFYPQTTTFESVELILALFMLKKIAIPLSPKMDTASIDYIITKDDLPSNYHPTIPIWNETSPPLLQGILGIYTSGSTGMPKLVLMDLWSITGSALSTAQFYNFTTQDKFIQTLPLTHIGGLMIFLRAWLLNANYDLQPPDQQFSKGVTLSLVPTQIQKIAQDIDQLIALQRVKLIILGGSSLPPHIRHLIQQHSLPVSLSYGMTETIAQVTATQTGDLSSSGHPLPEYGIVIEQQQIHIQSPFLAQGYLQHNILHRFNGYFISSDQGEMTVQGLQVAGRQDRIFISGGENISPEYIEQKILNQPGVDQVYLLPVQDSYFQQVGHLFFSSSTHTADSMKKLCKQVLLAHEVPKFFSPYSFPIHRKITQHELHQYISSRQKSRKTYSALLFLHGFMGSAQDWQTIIKPFEQDFSIITPEIPGHGQSQHPICKEAFYNYLYTLIQQYKTISLIGYSMGGRILLELLAHYPQLQHHISNCILESVHPGDLPLQQAEKRLAHDSSLFLPVTNKEAFDTFIQRWYQQELFGNLSNHPNYNQLLKNRSYSKVEQWQQAIIEFSVAKQHNTHTLLHSNPHNIFSYIYGEQDFKYAAIGKTLIPSYSITKAGHNTHFEQPERYISILKAIITND